METKTTLGESQRGFTLMVAQLILFMYSLGYEVSFGDAYRDPRLHGEFGEKKGYGIAKSNHKRRLAIDLNLFKDGKFLMTTEHHQMFGEFWESLDQKNRWGGRFDDGNHYEHVHEGWR